ncbi:pickpocket protein 28-like [Rhopalosiphum maidis]|uniref:pickpocket protein 28-like n=1 Tax=Rhopalosiphum maidis TaxID=43146 RepID=UPI000EFFDE9C|nr:pickpocket protein 28-like [Rhopalosiphum maidis]
MAKIKSKLLCFTSIQKHILKNSSLRNKFWTDDKYSTLYWISVLIGSFALCVFLSYDIVLKWYDSPVNRFNINEPRHISENPFPAITICHNDPISSNKMNLASVLNWERQNKTDEEWQTLNVVYEMCHWKHKIVKLENIDPKIVYKVLKEFSTKCEDTIKQIRWKDKIIDRPCEIMQPVFLLNNLCFSFNALPYHDMYRQVPYKLQDVLQTGKKWSNLTSNWNLDDGYSDNLTSIPWNMKSTSFWNTVEFILAQKDANYGCSSKQGFTVYFHSPSDVPDYSHSSLKLSKNSHSYVQIITQLSLTDDGLKSWTPQKRGCYYLNEKWLKYNTKYSYINCYVECQVNYTKSLCGCTPIFRMSSSFPVCGPKLQHCQANAAIQIQRAYRTCKCLPSCTDIDYELSYSTVSKNFSYIKKSLMFLDNLTDSNDLASIEATVNLEHTWPLRRNAEDTNLGYIGKIAGMTNLCRGVSLISVLENFYFFFINPFFQ